MADVQREQVDVVVIGAGPSGLAAAVEAAAGGLRVVLLEQAARVGGAYWRHSPDHLDDLAEVRLHHDWTTFRRLLARLRTVDVRTEHTVWGLERLELGFRVRALRGEVQRAPVVLDATSVVVATGTHDRVTPFPGWTLPGVMGAGGGQALLKGSLVAPGSRVALAGTGPLLLVVADGLLRSGVEVVAVAESGHPTAYGLHPSSWSGLASRSREAAAYVATLARHRVPYLAGHTIRAAHGVDRVERVTFATRRGRTRDYDVDALLVSHGFTPQLELLLQVGPGTRVDDDGSLVVVVDAQQRTSVPGVLATGEVTGVGGASLAILEGYVAGRALTDRPVDPAVLARIDVHRRFARTMHAVHAASALDLPDDELVCRCEEVTAGAVRAACRDLGVDDVRGAKLMTRAGMGLCQGRMCARAVTELVAVATGRAPGPDDAARAAVRLPAGPVPLSVLAREARTDGDT
jgi:D-hydroxyproline dehydrogenase subunit alpha